MPIKRVLVVDDDPLMTTVVTSLLRDAGVGDIRSAANGAEAQAHLTDHDAELVICDLNMPGMDGIQLLGRVAALGRRPSIILISGEDLRVLDSSRQYAEARQLVVLGALQKPVDREALFSLLAKFQPAIKPEDLRPRVAIDADQLREGLANGAVHIAYQPKLDLQTGELTGVEALLRWHSPQLGAVSPCDVVHAAEQSGFIDELTFAILRRAVEDRCELAHAGLDINIAINLSLMNLQRPDLVDQIQRILAPMQEAAGHFTLEVTETRLVADLAQTLETLLRLRLQGFGISLDDYGTGASTMQLLAQVPSTELKIDRSFITAAPLSEQGRTFLKSAVDLGLHLGLSIVAEGIETESECATARELGCHCGQGYLFAAPMSLAELFRWVQHRTEARAVLG